MSYKYSIVESILLVNNKVEYILPPRRLKWKLLKE